MNTRGFQTAALLALAAGLLGTTAARAQEDVVRPLPTLSYSEGLTAHGQAEVKVKPDIALLTFAVTTDSKDQAQAVAENAAKATALLSALREARIPDKDIQTLSYTVQPEYDYKNSPPVLTGYQVQNSVQATERDLTKVGDVLDKATAAGASSVNGVSFDLADRGKFEAQALAQAVLSARLKAAVMAQASGVTLGRLLTVTEGSPVSVQPLFVGAARMAAAGAERAVTPIADQQITVTAEATLIYALGPGKTP